jgi:Putative zinc-finger
MTRHLSTEQLSSYLDGEVGFSQAERIEDHLGECPACRARLDAMDRVVAGLRSMERPSPPAALAAAVRRGAEAARMPQSLPRRLQLLLSGFLSDVAMRPAFRTSVAMGLAMVFSVFLLSHGLETGRHPAAAGEPATVVTVSTYFGQPPLDLPPTTSEVAGREFVWSGGRWIQRGLEGKKPETHVAVASPEGRAMLSKYSDLEFLLADGTPVVMRYRWSTVELSGS